MSNYKFILSGGGTGGHIYPAVAIANELKSRYPNAEFLFVGAKDRMEMEKVPQAGYKIEGLWISGIQRKLTLKNLMFPFKVMSSLAKSKKIIKSFQPDLVVGTGGFASGPLLKVATDKKIPSAIQEQNSFPGITNKILAPKVNKIFVAFDSLEKYFPKQKIIKTGNPVREDLLEVSKYRVEAQQFFKVDEQKKTILVVGGSLGAKRINELIASKLDFFTNSNVQLIWQCGKLYFEQYKKYNAMQNVTVLPFIAEMNYAYAAADIIISRAGAGAVSELSIVGKPVIFIPSPNVAEDHQTKNAKTVADKEAAILIKEAELDTDFELTFTNLISSEEKQQVLSKNMKQLALPNATKQIVDELVKLLPNT
ncbi:undecaprenyldiphospho-muramoylpentapeptide beta-N-acetylglucosaminyltransferase [Zhouia sp. PK063]|uniref:undecaprenyldiphospho-muramoylpentapeptide beta-N-acetylglucosaminyltransferase n=1 Tax=Zhouia sp. PK063 TaxID=3373602 RepID=UPI00378E42A3